jgi:amidase
MSVQGVICREVRDVRLAMRPAAVVPADENGGQPVGVQIVGRRFREDMILDAAEAVERAVGVMAERLWRRGP